MCQTYKVWLSSRQIPLKSEISSIIVPDNKKIPNLNACILWMMTGTKEFGDCEVNLIKQCVPDRQGAVIITKLAKL